MEITDKSLIWFAVINIYAASEKAVKSWGQAEEHMKARGMVYHGSRTGRAGNAMEITFDACMAGYRRFIAVGGDGTVHDVLNGIAYNPQTDKVYLTGKNWARMYEIKLIEAK